MTDSTAEWSAGFDDPEGSTSEVSRGDGAPLDQTPPDTSTDSDNGAEPEVVVVPPPPGRMTLGSLLRGCAGVDEAIIRQAWPVRHRYTGLGGIVLGTAVAAAASMTLAISLTSSGLRWYFLGGPLLWGLLVFNLDRWLVSSTHGVGRPWKLIPRLVIAVLFGFIIAEPVVLWVFSDAIEEQILDERDAEISLATTRLKECNPEDDVAKAAEMTAEPTCEGFIVDREIPPSLETTTGSTQMAQLEGEIGRLDERLVAIEGDLASARDRYQREIRGESSGDTSGRRGIGPIARAIEQEITQLESERDDLLQDRDEVSTKLAELQARYDLEQEDLDNDRRELETVYSADTQAAVAERLEEVQSLNGSSIGLLQRFDALATLATTHVHILIARWLLTLFLIAVDSMPVIAKAIGGKSAYDHIYSRSLSSAQRRQHRLDQFAEQEHIKAIEHDKFRSRLRRSVGRKHAIADATEQILGLDDRLVAMHASRDLPFERSTWDVSEGEPIARATLAGFEWFGPTSGDVGPNHIDLRTPQTPSEQGHVAGHTSTTLDDAQRNGEGASHDDEPDASGQPVEASMAPRAGYDDEPTKAGGASTTVRSAVRPVEAAAEDDWLTTFRNGLVGET